MTMEPTDAHRLVIDSDLSVTAYGEALKILKPVAGEFGCVDLVLIFGPGCWYAAHEISAQAERTAGIMVQLVYDWENFQQDEWLLRDRVSGRGVWTPGACG